MKTFQVKDSGERVEYASGMTRDVQDGKINYLLVRDGPMLERWAMQLTKGAEKYGLRNWQLANSEEELERFRNSACRHFEQWLNGEVDEDHAAAVYFNINCVEAMKGKEDSHSSGSRPLTPEELLELAVDTFPTFGQWLATPK